MSWFRKFMTICFGWQYVLLIHNDGYKQVSRATREGAMWSWRVMPSRPHHRPHLSCLLLQGGKIRSSIYVKEWLPITGLMQAVYSNGH